MKKIKIIILFIAVIILSGCSGSYNITINDDLSVREEVNFKLSNANNGYERIIKLFDELKMDKEDYSINNSDDSIRITYKKDYNSIESYITDSLLYQYLFNDIDYSNSNRNLEFYASGFLKLNSTNKTNSNLINDLNIDFININIETNFPIVYTNSDSIDDNIMTWEINKDTHDKTINFKINIDNKNDNIKYIIVLILMILIVFVAVLYWLRKFIIERKIEKH